MNVPGLKSLMEFDGSVTCRREPGAANLALRGRCGQDPVTAWFAGAAGPGFDSLPPVLNEVCLYEQSAAISDSLPRHFRITARGQAFDLNARSLQLHRDVARAFFGAVPPPPVPLPRRLGWSALLLLLRVPGAEALLMRLRGAA